MTDWTRNNLAHWYLFQALKDLGHLSERRTFAPSGKIKMSALPFWVNGDSPGLRREKLELVALSLGSLLYRSYGGVPEPGVKPRAARKKLYEVLKEAGKTVAELGAVADEIFDFAEEED